jgi:2,3-bisphosphoglycerate-dependent phosphoglycerate mutase
MHCVVIRVTRDNDVTRSCIVVRMRQFVIAVLLALAATSVFAHDPEATTTIILVRHAEKAGPEGDVPLSEAGELRAKELARVLAGAKIDVIYTTPFKRTRDTAKPVAAAMKLTPIDVEATKTYASDVVRRVFEESAGKTVLIVGHSNTTVSVLKELGVQDAAPIADSQYDDLFVCTARKGAAANCVALRYGAAAR